MSVAVATQDVPTSAVPIEVAGRPSPWWLAGILVAETVAGVVVSYFLLFTTFAHYDDEGTFMVWDRQLLEGLPLYDVVWTFYGPVPFLVRHVLYRLLDSGPGHDLSRAYTMVLWLATCLLLALATHRLTRSLAAAALAYVLVFVCLVPIANEPAHSHSVVAVLLGALALVGTRLRSNPSSKALAAIGAIVAAMLFTKVNAGVFVGLAVALCAVAGAPRSRVVVAARWAVVLALATLAPAVMRRDFGSTGLGGFGVSYDVGLCLTALALFRAGEGGPPLRRWTAAALGGAVTTVVIVGATLALGSSLGALLHSIFVVPSRLMDWVGSYELRLPYPAWVLGAALFAVSTALDRRARGARSRDLLRAAVLVVLGAGSCVRAWSAELPRAAQYDLLVWGPPFAWLLVLPPGDATRGRAVLVACAVVMPLYAYPIAASQLTFATVLLVACGVLALYDGMVTLAPFLPSLRGRAVRFAAATTVIVGVAAGFASLLEPAYARHRAFMPLGLPGAARLRLPERDAAVYRWLAANVAASCETFLGSPGLNSLYLWADVPLPSPLLHDRWFLTFDEATRRAILDDFEAVPRRCAIRNRQLLKPWIAADRVGPDAIDGVAAGLQPMGSAGSWELFAPADVAAAPTQRGGVVARSRDERLLLWITPTEPARAFDVLRVTVYDPAAQRVVADTMPTPDTVLLSPIRLAGGTRYESAPWGKAIRGALVRLHHVDGWVETMPIVRVDRGAAPIASRSGGERGAP